MFSQESWSADDIGRSSCSAKNPDQLKILGDHVQPRILISWWYQDIILSQESWSADDTVISCSAKNPDQLMVLGDHIQPRILISRWYREIMFSQESRSADDIGRSCSAKNPDQLMISGDHVQPRILISWWYWEIMFSQESCKLDFCFLRKNIWERFLYIQAKEPMEFCARHYFSLCFWWVNKLHLQCLIRSLAPSWLPDTPLVNISQ